MPDTPMTNTEDLANTEYDAQRRARAGAASRPSLPRAPSGEGPDAGAPPEGGDGPAPRAGTDEPGAR